MHQFDRVAVNEFLKRTRESVEPRQELAGPDGSRLVLERNPAPGVLQQMTEVRADGSLHDHTRSYAPTAEPPAGYPADFPFLPPRSVAIAFLPAGAGLALTWETDSSPTAVAAEVMQACLAGGWRPAEPADTGLRQAMLSSAMTVVRGTVGFEFGVQQLVRGDRQRIIQVSGRAGGKGMVNLMDTPLASGGARMPIVAPDA